GRGRPRRTGLACTLGPQFGFQRRRDHMPDIDVRHFAEHRNQIIAHFGILELAPVVINAFFEQRGAEPLHHPTPDLLIDQLRVDDRAAILHHPMLQQLDEAGIGIDLQPGSLHAIGKCKGIFARDELPRRYQFWLKAGRQGVGTEINDPGQFPQFDAWSAITDIHNAIVDDIQLTRRRLQYGCSDTEDVLAQHFGGLEPGLAADAGTTGGPGTATIGCVVGIAQDTRTRSIETPSTLPAICAVSDSDPCPCSVMLVWQTTAPWASSRTATPSCDDILAPPTPQNDAL